MQILLSFLLLSLSILARAEALPADSFVQQAFAGQVAKAQTLWLTPALKQRAATILGHEYSGLRVRYWQAGKRSAWILDEIGKEQPITVGIIVQDAAVAGLQVLAYRESRGGEVQQAFFTRQFQGAVLQAGDRLSKPIDGITGATLSVAALQKLARLALLFDTQRPAS